MMNEAHNESALRTAICEFLNSEGRDNLPASANALDRHDRRIFLKIRDQFRTDIENATKGKG